MTSMGELVVANLDMMRRRARRLSRSREMAEDVLQAACLAALESTLDADAIDNPGAWLNGCVRNTYRNMRRKMMTTYGRDALLNPDAEEFGSDGAQESAADLRVSLDLLSGMTPRRRDAVLMAAAGYTLDEIGEMQGVAANTVSWNLKQARHALQAGVLPVDGRSLRYAA